VTDVDDLMATCPLKQEIRSRFWEPYVRQVAEGRPLRNYLTLYSPPMMDIKHLEAQGLLEFDGERYSGVTAVTYEDDAYEEAVGRLKGRPEQLLRGDINLLLARGSAAGAEGKQLVRAFPFEAINLDYTNSLFWARNKNPISVHLAALDALVDLQAKRGAGEFVLFVTSRVDRVGGNQDFGRKFQSLYAVKTGAQLRAADYEQFVSLGLMKMVVMVLASHRFFTRDCDSALLVRDGARGEEWLLHMGFVVRKGRLGDLRMLGRQDALEASIIQYLDKRLAGPHMKLVNRRDRKRLKKIHGTYVEELASMSFELPIPEPKDENAN